MYNTSFDHCFWDTIRRCDYRMVRTAELQLQLLEFQEFKFFIRCTHFHGKFYSDFEKHNKIIKKTRRPNTTQFNKWHSTLLHVSTSKQSSHVTFKTNQFFMFTKKRCDLNVLYTLTDNDSFGTETCSNVRLSFIKFNSVWVMYCYFMWTLHRKVMTQNKFLLQTSLKY